MRKEVLFLYNLYIDEKGPQNTFNKNAEFSMQEKISLGSDKMHSFVANALLLPKKNLQVIEKSFIELEQDFLSIRPQLRGKELKGSMILNKTNFKFGIASLNEREISFYNAFFSILEENDASNLFFSISKMAIIVSGKIGDWVLELDNKKFILDPAIFLYSLIKYIDIEAPANLIDKLLDKSVSTKTLLNAIREDLQSIVDKNKYNSRMAAQIRTYIELIKIIKKYNHIENKPTNNQNFDWSKFTYALDLWISEIEYYGENKKENINIFLDEGIKKEYLEVLKFNNVKENVNSKESVGLRMTDHLVVLLGNYMSKLKTDSFYNHEKPEKVERISNGWFELNDAQFQLIKRVYNFFLENDNRYSFINDTYFDESVHIQSYLKYINSYKSYESYCSNKSKHLEKQFETYHEIAQLKWNDSKINATNINNLYGSYKEAINSGDMRPL